MTQKREFYKCEICGNIVEVMHEAPGKLKCCGQWMVNLKEKTSDGVVEKHLPKIYKIDGEYEVRVGEILHPMEENHYIELIEVHTENKQYKKYLKPGEKPIAKFIIDEEIKYARAYCNLHGLWRG